ncbi:DNA polymerase [Candidatus Magnetobacterium bavaricum]|uniref:DNA polymerase n=1 Tax=Candidatus Magnetobacterium bavaricum TaxID=29290 RepID=A0A0F3GZB8_9BACT|nr:DNA polymerase [Candidatus Magnetobacterium bavaricum]
MFTTLNQTYHSVRKQNVSVRINLSGLEVDITPARKQAGNTDDHVIYLSKSDSWKQTNIPKHIKDISNSVRTNEIKILKIWRELHKLEFPSIYMEYLLVKNILFHKSKDTKDIANNVWHILNELAKNKENPLYAEIVDPANSNNILSDLLTNEEKENIINQAKETIKLRDWEQTVW